MNYPVSSYLELAKERLAHFDYVVASIEQCMRGEGVFYDITTDQNLTCEQWEEGHGYPLQKFANLIAHLRLYWRKEVDDNE